MMKKDKPLTKTQKFFKRLPHTTFFNPNFIGNLLDKKLIDAVKSNDIEKLKKNIRNGGDVNVKNGYGKTPLMIAAENGNENMVSLLLENNAKIKLKDDLNRTALHYGCTQKKLGVVSLLVNKYDLNYEKLKKKINIKDNNGNTPLHLAAMYNNYLVAVFLVSRGASKQIYNNDNQTPYTLAKSTNNIYLIKLLF